MCGRASGVGIAFGVRDSDALVLRFIDGATNETNDAASTYHCIQSENVEAVRWAHVGQELAETSAVSFVLTTGVPSASLNRLKSAGTAVERSDQIEANAGAFSRPVSFS
jgi:hypothetical protein